jgi:flagellar biosynthetic protein FliR
MPITDALIPHLPAFALILSRLTGLFVFAPLLSSAMVPRQIKVLLAFGLALAVYPVIDHSTTLPPGLDLFGLLPLMAGELAIGLSIGVLAAIPLMTAQLAGLIMGQQMGMGLAAVYNPSIDIEGDIIGQILFFVAMASYLVAGGLELVYGTLLGTFRNVPIGAFALSQTPVDVLVGVVHSGFDAALRIAMPVLLILTLETVAAGLIMKTVPSLNIMNIGFPVRILLGMLMIIASLAFTIEILMGNVDEDLTRIAEWARSLGPVAEVALPTTGGPTGG